MAHGGPAGLLLLLDLLVFVERTPQRAKNHDHDDRHQQLIHGEAVLSGALVHRDHWGYGSMKQAPATAGAFCCQITGKLTALTLIVCRAAIGGSAKKPTLRLVAGLVALVVERCRRTR